MSVVYRPARTEDLQRSGELVVWSMNKLCERHGFGPIATVRAPAFSLFSLSDDPDGLCVAEDDGEILGTSREFPQNSENFFSGLVHEASHPAAALCRESAVAFRCHSSVAWRRSDDRLVIGYNKSNMSALLKRFLSRVDEVVARVSQKARR